MKKIFVVSIWAISSFCAQRELSICDYNASHKNALMHIALQDPIKFLAGYSATVSKGLMTHDQFICAGKEAMEKIFQDPDRVKRVALDSGKIAGFVTFHKTTEMSLEKLKSAIEAQKLPFDEQKIMAAMPSLKRTDAECHVYAEIETLAVSQESRSKGFGRALIKDAIQQFKRTEPSLKKVVLGVNIDNQIARKLYESEGFMVSEVQPHYLTCMAAMQYEKEL